VQDTQHDVDFMLKDAKRLADSGGWGHAESEYNTASNAFTAAWIARQFRPLPCTRRNTAGKQMLSDGKPRERRGLEDGAWSFTS